MEDAVPPGGSWYGWQTLVVFGASSAIGTGTGAIAAGTGSEAVAPVGAPLAIGGGLLGGPIVHFAHGNVGKGFGALGLNLGFSAVGAGISATVACGAAGLCDELGQGGVALGVGAGIGLAVATVIDVAALAYDEPRRAKAGARRPGPSVAVHPDVRVTGERATLGLLGTF